MHVTRSIAARTSLLMLGLASVHVAHPGPHARAQACPEALPGAWTGRLPIEALLAVRLVVREQAPDRLVASIASQQVHDEIPIRRDEHRLRVQSSIIPIAFDGVLADDRSRIDGFLQHGSIIERVVLRSVVESAIPTWSVEWSPIAVRDETTRFDLYIEDEGAGDLGGYFFFRDQRLPGLWGYGLQCHGDSITLGEKNLGLVMEGGFDPQRDVLRLTVTGFGGSSGMTFSRMSPDSVPARPDVPEAPARSFAQAEYRAQAPETVGDGWPTAPPATVGLDTTVLGNMVSAIVTGELALTHSVLVARHGSLVVEEYFYGYDRATWHDMRSASKTLTSTLIGLAIQEGRIASTETTALSFFPRYRRYAHWDPRKAQITIRDLLTMSSGLDANDSDPTSVASEGAYQSQTERPDWIKLALDAPMIADPGSQPLYGGANPLILGGILAEAVDEPVEWFAHRTLFGPLGIEHYKLMVDPTGVLYMGGGLYLRPRDMAKYGQLYLDGGVWQGRRLLSEEWIRESWGRYGRLGPLDRNGHQYGYLWWHHQYPVGDRVVETIEARGNGGQYIFVVPSLDMVVVITSGNFHTGKTRQPEEILRRFILPAVRDP